MSLIYVHVSDIHFGQERGSEVHVHDDVKQSLITDVEGLKTSAGIQRMDGVIVTGDIAFSGKKTEYDRAAQWLDRLTEAIGCDKTDVIVVPGNHDIDRDMISPGAKLMLPQIAELGADELHRYLENAVDREVLYAKFHDYRDFAEGYGCPLESNGGVAVDRSVKIASGRFLRFVGLNSALLCTGRHEDEGKLLIGTKQQVLPRTQGEELVVLCHHPLESLQDEKTASRYIRSRARVHIFGHVHNPSIIVHTPFEGADLLTMSAGATVPPNAEDGYQYTYNLLRFDWESRTEGLKIEIEPRTWNEQITNFNADTSLFGKERLVHVLQCPNFRKQRSAAAAQAASADACPDPAQTTVEQSPSDAAEEKNVTKSNDLLRLHFFRDLSAEQRVHALIEAGVLPCDWKIELTHTIERLLLDQALGSGLQDELATAVGALRAEGSKPVRGREG